MIRTCKQCSSDFELDYATGRPRERCFTCQPVGMRVRSSSDPAPRRAVWRSEPAPPGYLDAFERFVRVRGAEDSLDGRLLLLLGRRSAEGGLKGGDVVALTREIIRIYRGMVEPPKARTRLRRIQ